MITTPAHRINELTSSGLWENLTLHGMLANSAQHYPSLLAVADAPNKTSFAHLPIYRLSFNELDNASTHMACQLLNAGLSANDTIVAQLPNIVELMTLYMAVSKIGAIISPIPVQYGTHEIAHVCSAVKAKAFITLDLFKDIPLFEPAIGILERQTKAINFNDTHYALDTSVNQNEQQQLQLHQQQFPSDANHILTICWTSGTTGLPKGVPRSHNMWCAIARCCAEGGGFKQGDRLLNPFPMVNMAALATFLYSATLIGCSVVLHHPLEPMVFLKQMQDESITFTIAPPALLNQLAKSEELWRQFDFSALRTIGSGSAPLAPWMIDIFDNTYGKPVINFYGSNEGISLISFPAVAPDAETRASMFPRLGSGLRDWGLSSDQFICAKVLDVDTGEEITEPGKVGELIVKGPTLFDGYHDSKNDNVFTADGFFRTGDLVEICGNPSHFVRIYGRSKDIINRGGMKISPTEIDVLLEGLPGAIEAAVCSFFDDRLGEKICACVVVDPEQTAPSLTQIAQYLSDKGLAKFKLPEHIEFFDSLPRNPLNKVKRFVLHDIVKQRLG